MRRFLFAVLSVLVLATSCEPAYAGMPSPVVNRQGTAGAPVPVTTSAAVTIIPAGNDASYCFASEGSDLRVEYGDAAGDAPAIAPDATHGILFPYVKGLFYCERSGNARVRVDAIAIGSNTSVDTQEEPGQ